MDELPGLWSLTPLGALVGFIVLLGWMLATGKLVTRREVELRITAVENGNARVLAEKDSRILELASREERLVQRGDDWHAASDQRQATIELLQEQLGASIETGRLVRHVITSLPIPTNGGQTGDVEES